MPLSNAALETALDLLESRPEDGLYGHYERSPERQPEDSAFDRLRRLAAVRPANPLPSAPAAVAEAEPDTEQKPAETLPRVRTRRPSVQIAPASEENADDRLAGVIQGLSEALSQTTVEKDERFGS